MGQYLMEAYDSFVFENFEKGDDNMEKIFYLEGSLDTFDEIVSLLEHYNEYEAIRILNANKEFVVQKMGD